MGAAWGWLPGGSEEDPRHVSHAPIMASGPRDRGPTATWACAIWRPSPLHPLVLLSPPVTGSGPSEGKMTGSCHVHFQVRPLFQGAVHLWGTPHHPQAHSSANPSKPNTDPQARNAHNPSLRGPAPGGPQPLSSSVAAWGALSLEGPWLCGDLPSCPAHPVGAPGTPHRDPHPEASGCPLGWAEPGPPWGGAAPSAPLAAPPWTKTLSPGGKSTDQRDLPPPCPASRKAARPSRRPRSTW